MSPITTGPAAVLVVEDDEFVRATASAILRRAGYHTIAVENGDIALMLLAEDVPIGLLFTDVVMPGQLNGLRLASKAIAIRPELKVLYATGFSSELRYETADLHGTMLLKPYTPTQLLAEIGNLVGPPPAEPPP